MFPFLWGWASHGIYINLLTQDHLLPYCLAPKHAPDTLFIIAEGDWRLCVEDTVPLEETAAYQRYVEAMRATATERRSGQSTSSGSAEPIAAPVTESPGY